MSLILTLLSIVLAYFSPAEVVPSLSPYHVQQIIILPALLASAISLNMRRGSLPAPQSLLIVGFWFAAVISVLSKFWLRAAANTFITCGLLVCIYFLVYFNAFSLARIHVLGTVVVICALIMAVQGILAYHTGYMEEKLLNIRIHDTFVIDRRICGVGFLHDPNDFAQFLLVGLTFLGFFWKKDNVAGNFILLCVPAAVLIYATYLTFSRGAIFGVAAIIFVAVYRRIGKVPSAFVAGILFFFMLAMNFGGGREISMQEGSAAGRIVAWGSGIAQLKKFPLFGAGFEQFTEYNDLTAHNSFVLCFAELGLFGYFFWLGLILITGWGLESLARLPRKTAADAEFGRYLTTVRASLYSFLVTAWFLSRTYTVTLYILLALGAVLIGMRREAYPWLSMPTRRWVPVTLAVQVASLLLIYAMVRLRSL